MSNDRLQKIRLQPGQTTHWCLADNESIAVLSGKLRVQGPRQWISETVVCPSVVLEEHQARRFETGGWVSMHAVVACEFHLHSPQPRGFTEWLAGWMPRLTSVLRGSAG
jgi:hypothetical protein